MQGRTELSSLGGPETVSFLNEDNVMVLCSVTKPIAGTQTRSDCWWCTFSFDTPPIGCPVRYVHAKARRSYTSEINKEHHTIYGELPSSDIKEDDKTKLVSPGYYETIGAFCSFNCCQAYIDTRKHDALYDDSFILLRRLYRDIVGKTPQNLIPAPHWSLLTKFGGNMSLEEFRNSFENMHFVSHGLIHPLSEIYEKRLQL